MEPNEVYVGARYVPVFADEPWSSEREYEPLTIVLHEGNSYTSRQFVPTGIEISNGQYWALTGNLNGQISSLSDDIANLITNYDAEFQSISDDIDDLQTEMDSFGSKIYKATDEAVRFEVDHKPTDFINVQFSNGSDYAEYELVYDNDLAKLTVEKRLSDQSFLDEFGIDVVDTQFVIRIDPDVFCKVNVA